MVSVPQKTITPSTREFKLYRRRWFMMIIFVLFAYIACIQWAQYTIIANLVTKYYGVTATQVEWTATVFTFFYILFVFPSIYVTDKLGVRNSLILGSVGICIGTWIKAFSVAEDRFIFLMIGQCFTALFFILLHGLTGRFTALWFGADEISTAGVIALLGDQSGVACAFFLPSVIVKDGSKETIAVGLKTMNYIVAGVSTLVMVLVILCLKAKPKLPPCLAQVKQQEAKKENVWKALKSMFSKRAFLFVMCSYGLNAALYIAVATVLNTIISVNFPNQEEHAGRIGGLMMLVGMIASVSTGRILDKTRRFKESALVLVVCAFISFAAFTISLKCANLALVYISLVSMGFFTIGYYATGFQMGIEITYPVSEGISTAVMFFAVNSIGCILTIVYGYTVKTYGDLPSNIGLLVAFVVTIVITVLIPADLKRQEAENSNEIEKEMKNLI